MFRIFTHKEKIPATRPFYLFNTLTKQKEVFEPISDVSVRMYNCGPTVYDYQHIGNLRPYIFANVLRRALEYNGFTVKQVINITDVGHLTSNADEGEDKIEQQAEREGKRVRDIVSVVTDAFFKDLDLLNIKRGNILFPHATKFIKQQIALVKTLEEKGYTYTISDGVYFDTKNFTDYGKLGNIDTVMLKEGARVEKNPEKHNPADFALWKFSPTEGPKRQQEWGSPWGVGYPGWHIECTAMVFSLLGKQIDIHTGGIDHIPIHHNNEIAQAEAAAKKPFVRYWVHNAFITIEGQKIAKSVGNTIYVRNIVDRGFSPLALRYWFLTGSYRSPMNFTWEAIEGAHAALFKLHRYFIEELGKKAGVVLPGYQKKFHEYINDDLDTPKAIALLWELVKDGSLKKEDKRTTLLDFDRVLGIGLAEGNARLRKMLSINVIERKDLPEKIRSLVGKREDARKSEDWERADKIRDELNSLGYTVEDTSAGSQVHKS